MGYYRVLNSPTEDYILSKLMQITPSMRYNLLIKPLLKRALVYHEVIQPSLNDQLVRIGSIKRSWCSLIYLGTFLKVFFVNFVLPSTGRKLRTEHKLPPLAGLFSSLSIHKRGGGAIIDVHIRGYTSVK